MTFEDEKKVAENHLGGMVLCPCLDQATNSINVKRKCVPLGGESNGARLIKADQDFIIL